MKKVFRKKKKIILFPIPENLEDGEESKLVIICRNLNICRKTYVAVFEKCHKSMKVLDKNDK